MSKYKRGHQQSVDKNELEIIKVLEDEGYFIVRGMDDFLVYSQCGDLTQVEVKTESPFSNNGTLKAGKIKDSQYKMLCYANESYIVLWTKEQALSHFCEWDNDNDTYMYPHEFRDNYKEWLTPKELNRLRQLSWWNLG
jgi:hypothetical protein